MRVLLLHERFSPDVGGGGEYAAMERARGLAAAGHDVRVLCPGDPSIREHEGIPTRRIRVARALTLLLLPAAIAEALRADVVHGFTFHAAPLAWLAARLTGRPVVCEQLGLFGDTWLEMRPGLAGRAIAALERLQLRLPFDRHLFLSEPSLRLAREIGFTGAGQVVAPGIGPAPPGGGSLPETPVVLFAGRFDRRKGIDRLYAVAGAMPDVRFEAVGWPGEAPLPPPPSNLTIIEGRGAPYRDALARASILLMPSRAETFGIVIYEAMQAGCSIVSTIGGGYEGVHLEVWDEAEAVRALRQRVDDRALLAREAEANRALAARYTWARSTAEVESIYAALTSSGNRHAGGAGGEDRPPSETGRHVV